MIELPDDELDKLFRKSSEEFDPQFDPEDWNSLKKRLDETDGRNPAAWFRKWWPLGLLLLLIPGGIASYYLLSKGGGNEARVKIDTVSRLNDPKLANTERVTTEKQVAVESRKADIIAKAEDKAQLEKENAVVNVEQPESDGVTAKKTEVLGLKNSPSNSATVNAKEKSERKKLVKKDGRLSESSSKSVLKAAAAKSSTSLPRSQSKAGGVYLEPNRSKVEGGDGALSLAVSDKVRKNDSNGTNASELGARQAIGSNGVTSVAEDERMLISAANLNNRALRLDSKVPYPEIIAPASALPIQDEVLKNTDEEQTKKDEVVESPKWAVRLGYSPDLTTVGFKNLTKPGSAFSLLFEYGISERLYLQTGLARSVKDYYAFASDYKLPGYVTAVNTPYGVDGTCTMYEIPLGVRYDLTQTAHSRWFAGTGFSSYYAQSETYKYRYKDYVHMQKPGWKGKTGLYLFSHVNASVGYERTITRKLSILAEPYIRIPLKGVGYGKVNLITTGMWLSLRYTPAFR
ncbi:MAG: hypothetical protein ABIN80_24510 [Dyadobacter sp.]|uniref:hypothetical protein n=1 Tax=Dyadobacter sp. TaxID=1914288 RepID=UPI0032670641